MTGVKAYKAGVYTYPTVKPNQKPIGGDKGSALGDLNNNSLKWIFQSTI